MVDYAEKMMVSRDRLEEALMRLERLEVLVQAVEDNEEYSGISLMTTWMDELLAKSKEDILYSQRVLCKCIQNIKYGESIS